MGAVAGLVGEMIVCEEWDKFRLWGPRVFKAPWYRPIGVNEKWDPWCSYDVIIFTPECDPDVHDFNVYINIWDVPWRWTCQSCYAASGDDRSIFKTDWEKREHLGGQGSKDVGGFSEPSRKQQDQMSDHAKQHSIMWSWARGLK